MITDEFKSGIEAKITAGCPLPLSFHWEDKGGGSALLQIAMPVETPAGRPIVIVAFPAAMPKQFVPRAIARAKAVIDEIFEQNMVAVVIAGGPRNGIVKPQNALLLPDSLAMGRA
jgi:hypothetical protein